MIVTSFILPLMIKSKNISTQDDWDNLLNLIHEGTLTPVIGQELFKYKENNELFSIDNYLSKKLLEKFDVTDPSPATLTETAGYLLSEKNVELNDNIEFLDGSIIEYLDTSIKNIKFDFPLLTDLLEIGDLKYFINTTVFSSILEDKIKKVRNEKDVDSKDFSPYSLFSFEQNLKKLSKTFVFNVFGSFESGPAISEDDMLEFTSQWSEKTSIAPNLLIALQNNNILFLGCAYPKWMIRFVLRLLTSQAMNDWGNGKPRRKIYVVNDISAFSEEQNRILKNYNVVTYDGGTNEFMSQLLQQWKKKFEKPKSIFLSYTRGDKEAVENLKKGLEQVANIRCWYDTEDLELATRWREEIIIEIDKADLFIPLISNNSLNHKGFVEKEWDAAWNTNVVKKKTGEYLIPIVIDGTDPYDKRVPKEFTDLNIGKIPQGNPDEQFINRIKNILNIA